MITKFGLPLTVPTDMRQINAESNSMFNISLLFRRSLLNVTTHFRSKFNSSDCFPDCLQTQQTRHCVVQKVSTLCDCESECYCFLHFLRLLAVCWPSAQVHPLVSAICWFLFEENVSTIQGSGAPQAPTEPLSLWQALIDSAGIYKRRHVASGIMALAGHSALWRERFDRTGSYNLDDSLSHFTSSYQ